MTTSSPASSSSNPGPATVTGNDYLLGGDASGGINIGNAAGSTIGFYGATPVVQPNGTGNTHTVAAGSTTSVFINTTFDGSIGSTAYTVGDIVKALKQLGILQS